MSKDKNLHNLYIKQNKIISEDRADGGPEGDYYEIY